MNKLLKATVSLLLIVAVCFTGCNKPDDSNNGGNNGNNAETPEAAVIVSTSEVQCDGTVYIETVFDNETKMYFEILSPNEVALVNGEFYYQDNPSLAYKYRGDVVIPECIKHLGTIYTVVSIAKEAFYYNEMVTSVYIPNSVLSIKMYQKSMFHGAFQGCANLNELHMSENIQIIEACSFADCKCYKQSVTIPKHVKSIGADAFSSETVYFNADSCTIAGGYNVTQESILYYSSAFPLMSSISFGNDVKTLPAYLFYKSNITTFDVPTSVTIIFDNVFLGCNNLSNVNISNSVIAIGNSAFLGCENLTEILIPHSINQIDDYAFYASDVNTSIKCMATDPPSLGNNVFGMRSIQTILVPFSSVQAYKTADGWSQYADVIVGIRNADSRKSK